MTEDREKIQDDLTKKVLPLRLFQFARNILDQEKPDLAAAWNNVAVCAAYFQAHLGLEVGLKTALKVAGYGDVRSHNLYELYDRFSDGEKKTVEGVYAKRELDALHHGVMENARQQVPEYANEEGVGTVGMLVDMFHGFLSEEDQDKLLNLNGKDVVTIYPCKEIRVHDLALAGRLSEEWDAWTPTFGDIPLEYLKVGGERTKSRAVVVKRFGIKRVQDDYPHIGEFLRKHEVVETGEQAMSVKLRYPYESGNIESICRLPQGYNRILKEIYWAVYGSFQKEDGEAV